MRSKKVTINVPWPLYEVFQEMAPKVGYTKGGKGHNSEVNRLLLWSAVYSVIVGKYHHITAPIADAAPDVQDQIIADIVEAYHRGESGRGSYFEAVLEDVMKKFNLPVSPEVVHATIAQTVRQRPKRGK